MDDNMNNDMDDDTDDEMDDDWDDDMDDDMDEEPEPHNPLPIGASEPPRRVKQKLVISRVHFQPDPRLPSPGRDLHAFLFHNKEKKYPRLFHAQATTLQQESGSHDRLPQTHPGGKLNGETDPDNEKAQNCAKPGGCGENSLLFTAPKQIGIPTWLTVTEVSTDYCNLITRVDDWVSYFASPLMRNQVWRQNFARAANSNLEQVIEFKRCIARYPDISNACLYHNTDLEILTSLVLRFLNEYLFAPVAASKVDVQLLGGELPLLAARIRNAQAEAVRISSPEYLKSRQERSRALALMLVNQFLAFALSLDMQTVTAWRGACQRLIVEPAMALQEKFLTSPQDFRFDCNSTMRWNERREIESDHTHFYRNLDKFECFNVLQHKREFSSQMLTQDGHEKELVVVMTRTPSLYMRQFQPGKNVGQETLVVKKQFLVAYGKRRHRERFLRDVEPALINFYRT